jgi:hypothetical protein
MRIKHFVLLAAVMCFVMPLFVLGASAKSSVRVKHVPKSKLEMLVKGVGSFKYNAKLNRWEGIEGLTLDDVDISRKPVIFKPSFIGPRKLPAYMDAGNMMADPCDRSYIVITDRSYAIVISTDCTGDGFGRLDKYAKTFRLPKGVHAVRAKEEAGWKVID